MHHANARKIKNPARSPKKSLAHSPAPLCGTPRRNSARASWAAGFIGQHTRAPPFFFPQPARAPHCAACRWQMPRSVTYCRFTQVFLCGSGYSFRRQPAPRAPPLAHCSRGSGARLALTTCAPTLRYGKRNARPSRARENDILADHGGRSCVRPLSGARVLRPPLPPWGIPFKQWLTRLRKRADAPARRCAAQGKDFMRSHLQADAPARGSRDCAASADAPTRGSRKAKFYPFRLADNIRAAAGLLSRAKPLRGAIAPLTAPGLRVKKQTSEKEKI